MHDPQSITMNDDQRMIPVWSIAAAALAFVLMEYYWWLVAPGQRHHPAAPLGLRIYFNLSWGILSSLYFLMLGYISKDAPRRAMSLRLWMVVCFVLPGGIGALLPAPPARGFKVPRLRHPCAERLPFLSPVQLPAHRKLRQLLPHRARL